MKMTVTIGIDSKGVASILAGPNEDTDGQIKAVEKLTDKGGKLGTGKNAIQFAEVEIMNTQNGRIRHRRFAV